MVQMSPLAIENVNLVKTIVAPLKKEVSKTMPREIRQMPAQRLSQCGFNDFIAQQELFKQRTNAYPLFLKLLAFSENGSNIGTKGLERMESAINISPQMKALSKIGEPQEDSWIEYASSFMKNAVSENVDSRVKAAEKLLLVTDDKLVNFLVPKFNSDFGTVRKALGFSLPKLKQKATIIEFSKNNYDYIQEGLARNLRYIEDKALREKLIFLYSSHKNIRLRGSFIDNVFASGDEKLIMKYLKCKDVELKKYMAESTHLIENKELREKAKEILSKGQFSVAEKLKKGISHEDFNSQRIEEEKFIAYTKAFNENLSNIDKIGLLSFFDVSPTIHNLKIIGSDKNEIKNIITDYNKALDFTLKHKDEFTEETKLTEEEIKTYFKENANKILNSLLLAPREVLQEKLIRKKGKPDAFLNQMLELADEKDILGPIRKLMQEPYTDDKIDSSERQKLLNLSYGIIKMGEKENLLRNLAEMIKNGRVDINKLNNHFLDTFQRKLNIENKVDGKELTEKLDLNSLHFLFPALSEMNSSYAGKINGLIKSGLENKYTSYLFDPQSEVGKANLKTKQIFTENGLNYDKWLNYDKEHHFISKDKSPFSLKVWNRIPGIDIFLGNKAQNCTALNGMNKEGAIDDLLNTFVQNVEIKRDSETVGQITVLWLKDSKNKLRLLVDSSSISKKFMTALKNERREINHFLSNYAKEVFDQETEIIYGDSRQVFNFKDLKPKNLLVHVLGDTVSYINGKPEPTYYVNSFKWKHWSDINSLYDKPFFSPHLKD